MLVVILGIAAIYLGFETLRWVMRPAARRVRRLGKLKGPSDVGLN